MPLFNGSIDQLIMEERMNIQKYLAGQIDLKIEIDKKDQNIFNDMEDESIWYKKLQSKKILA